LSSQDVYYRAACLGALTGMFGVVVHSFVDFGLHITINALLFLTLLVIAVQADRLSLGEGSGGLTRKAG
jgi:hypothetical protein